MERGIRNIVAQENICPLRPGLFGRLNASFGSLTTVKLNDGFKILFELNFYIRMIFLYKIILIFLNFFIKQINLIFLKGLNDLTVKKLNEKKSQYIQLNVSFHYVKRYN